MTRTDLKNINDERSLHTDYKYAPNSISELPRTIETQPEKVNWILRPTSHSNLPEYAEKGNIRSKDIKLQACNRS